MPIEEYRGGDFEGDIPSCAIGGPGWFGFVWFLLNDSSPNEVEINYDDQEITLSSTKLCAIIAQPNCQVWRRVPSLSCRIHAYCEEGGQD